MKRYLVFSGGGHLVLVTAWLVSGVLLSKPRMSYYAVDLVSSLPAGGQMVKEAPAPTPPAETPRVPPDPHPVKERKLPMNEVIKVKSKPKKEVVPKPQKKQSLNLKAALAVLDGQEKPRSRPGPATSSASNVTAEAGDSFPYPWYLKLLANKLDEKWNPPTDFPPDTVCTIAFVIQKQGEVTRVVTEKSSGDTTYDELARRAVMYSNPLPPLPAGYPEDTLNVHMTFHGK